VVVSTLKGVDPASLPWARSVESKLSGLERGLSALGYNVNRMPDSDKAVYAEFSLGQNINTGTNGKIDLTYPTSVRYSSSTGVFEVTVSLAGLVRDGAVLGLGFESDEFPSVIEYDLPLYGVVDSALVGATYWKPFAASYSTTITTRPGVQDLSLYAYAVCTSGDYSAGFIKRASLSVKPV